MPAMVLDARWDVLQLNVGAQWLAATLMPWSAQPPGNSQLNMLDMLIHPHGFTNRLLNFDEVGPVLLSELRRDSAVHPSLSSKVDAFAALLRDRLGPRPFQAHGQYPSEPLLTLKFGTVHGDLSFFRMFSTFGSPQDITLASLRVEHMFAADDLTHAVLRREVGFCNA
jgi:hypothetical protein